VGLPSYRETEEETGRWLAPFYFVWEVGSRVVLSRLGLPLLLIANVFLFRALGSDYLRWYVTNGALIALVFGFIAATSALDDVPDLISPHPVRYMVASSGLLLNPHFAWFALFWLEAGDRTDRLRRIGLRVEWAVT
jgi:hypothetical protein